ncbi:ParB N-terminal domain-containing protein [Ruminococcus sp. Marseille-P6503]|uniref:ParB/RepB/Spo0J family partition protein n=1 Tax=Ruminococcus sp. Marseille-P6503 TaxID=2364796 RepID=UPI000F526EF7|nr:ParB N-terminal domain-containing protein [Ruminococcus sp. Marseille-P6503]
MQTYICKCGKTFQKSSKADSTGYVLSEYSPEHECFGCPYIVIERDWRTKEIIKRECRATPKITYTTRCQIGTSDKDYTSCHLYTLDLVFAKRVLNFIKSLDGSFTGSPQWEFSVEPNSLPKEWRAADFGKCYCFKNCFGLAIIPLSFQNNKKGTEARRAVMKRFFCPDGTRKNVTEEIEKQIVLQRIEIAKENAELTVETKKSDNKEGGKMSSLLERRTARQESIQAEEQNTNPLITSEYNSLWANSGKRIELLEPKEIELFRDSKGNAQPDRLQENKILKIMASAEDVGILQPAVVRIMPDGKKQMLAGRHRREAAIRLNVKLPCELLYNIDDITAYKIMAETNTRGDEQFPSEQGMIYNAYLEMRTSGGEEKTVKEIAAKFGVSEKTIYRYIRILELPKKLQEAIDYKIIPIGKLEELFKFTTAQQEAIGDYIDYYEIKHIRASELCRLLLVSERDDWDTDFVWKVLNFPDEVAMNQKNDSGDDKTPTPLSASQTKIQNNNESDNTSEDIHAADTDNDHTVSSLIEKIRSAYPKAMKLSDSEICELVLNVLAEVFN